MTNITVEKLKEKLDNGETVHLVDVREPHEREEYHIGGTFIPLGKVQTMEIEDIEHLKGEEIICYCRSGHRSMIAAMILEQLGFQNTKNLTGGVIAWKNHIDK